MDEYDIKIDIDGERSRDIKFISKLFEALQKVVYVLARNEKSITKGVTNLSKKDRTTYALSIKDIKLSSFHVGLVMPEPGSRVVSNFSFIIQAVYDNDYGSLDTMLKNPQTKMGIISTLPDIWSTKDNLVKIGFANKSISLDYDKREVIKRYKNARPVGRVEQLEFFGRLVAIDVAKTKLRIDSTEGSYNLNIPRGKEEEFTKKVQDYLGKIVKLDGNFRKKVRSAEIVSLDDLRIAQESTTYLDHFEREGKIIKLYKPLLFEVSYNTEDKVFILNNEEFGIYSVEPILSKAYLEAQDRLEVMVKSYLDARDDELTEGAKKLKVRLEKIISG
jgi:hypothetical protein